MPVINHTVIRQEVSFAAGDAAIVDNLPVNPVSFVDITLRGQTATANVIPTLDNMLAVLANIEVLLKGSAFISIRPLDLYILQHMLGWLKSGPQPRSRTAGELWRLMLRLSFSRRPYWGREGMPAQRPGELQLRLTPAASFANVGTVSLLVEVTELLEATFERFLKYSTASRTPSATGESDVLLPLGNKYVGILLFGTTVPTAATATASMREVRFMLNNQETIYPKTRWDALHQRMMERINSILWLQEHVHLENLAGVYTANVASGAAVWDDHSFNNHAWIDFDPLQDDTYLVDSAGLSEAKLRINADVADAQRIIPVELLGIPGAAPGALPRR